ncbi:MAG TPA: hypothetical protein VGO93_04435 [Candidatus Xenobia bacterium]|jgi:hypothetical protein
MVTGVSRRLSTFQLARGMAGATPTPDPRDVATLSCSAPPALPPNPSPAAAFAAVVAPTVAVAGAVMNSDDAFNAVLARDLPGWASKPGQLSRADVDKRVVDAKITGDDAAALAVVAEGFDDLAKANQGAFVTLADFEKVKLGHKFEENQNVLKTAAYDHLNGPLDYKALQQGDVGDCYFLSALDDEVRFHPDRVAGWSEKNADGSCTITFPYRFVSPQRVTSPTETEICLHASSGANGTWATDYETAWENALHPGTGRKGEDGQDPVLGIQAVTGHDASDEEIPSVALADIHKQLTDAFADPTNPKIVEVSTYDAPSPNHKPQDGPTRTYTNGLIDGHAYSLQGYDPKTRLVTIRNPWGSNPPSDAVKDLGNGEFQYTLAQMIDQFEMLTMETDKPAPAPTPSPVADHAKKVA